MKNPVFAHGSRAKILEAIGNGRFKYPTYFWIDDGDQYAFLNKQGELEITGVPRLTGTLDNQIILSDLANGIYLIAGQHKITEEDATVYLAASFILCIIQEMNGIKKIRRLTAGDIDSYEVKDGSIITTDHLATTSYLEEQGYASETYVDTKLAALKIAIEEEITQEILDTIPDLVDARVDARVAETIHQYQDSDIEEIFN